MKFLQSLCLVLSILALPLAAGATPLDRFTVIGGGLTVTFTLPASPTPTGTDAACVADLPPEFCISGVATTVNGVPETGDEVEFFDFSQGGGLALLKGGVFPPLVDTLGAQLYSGPVTAPTFLLGTFDQSGFPNTTVKYTVTISQIPEPGSLMLLGSGVVGMAAAVRRRR